ncbi:hypothetical protein LPB86_20010 [Pedobacter sp. MC2016-14]|uniref:hypothetical protein n=1 Tax=Pedobacter sp. MC2016-14 TaxID=2897327 RepID=UPI001E3E4EA9|nr:hypothetical protein [Pedobacter sp. MC2016-14]MCD0490535.1 hypothetical protein [Pedobacter sp. MC2016-14]
MKKTLLLSAAILLFANAFAQNPVQPVSADNPWNNRPDVVIKGEELKNFPGGQLFEMLLGRLPGFDQVNPTQTAITIVVDGFVWTNIDALNINNIEEIAYYRGGLNTKFGVQNVSPGGVLYITSKSAKFNQPLRADVNTIVGSSSLKKDGDKDHSIFQSYHVALSQGSEKLSWRAAAVFNENSRSFNELDFTHQFQLNGDVRFSPLKWLDLGANVNYAPLEGDSEFKWNPVVSYGRSGSQSTINQDNWNGNFYVKLSPVKGLVNETRILRNNVLAEQDDYTSSVYDFDAGRQVNSTSLTNQLYRNIAVLNELSYRFGLKEDRIKFKLASNFQFNDQRTRTELQQNTYTGAVGANPGNTQSTRMYWIALKSKTYTYSGDFFVNIFDILSLQAGLRGDHFKGDDKRLFFSPYYYADLSLKNLFLKDVNPINEVLLFGSYGQYLSGINIISSALPVSGIPTQIPSFNGFSEFSGLENDKMRMQSYGLKTRFLNRVSLSADWYKNDNYNYIAYNYNYPFGSSLVYALFPVDNTGWRIWSTAEIFNKQKFKWNAGLNVFRNNVKIGTLPGTVTMAGTNVLENKTATQAGMQHDLFYANFSLSTNTAAYFNHPVFSSNLVGNGALRTLEKASFINLNYLSLGYNLKERIGGATLRNLNVAFVARNLTQRKKNLSDYTLSKTLGLAVNASF